MAAAWCFMLVATLWSVSAALPAVAIAALGIIGLAAATMVLALARRPEPTLAEVRHVVDRGRTA